MFENTSEIEKSKFSEFYQKIPKDLLEKEDKYQEFAKKSGRSKKARIFPIYQMVDSLMLSADGLTVCKKGCSACCKGPVQISKMEAVHIAFKENLKIDENAFTFFPSQAISGPCPFLKDDVCSIYANRPYACRRTVQFESANKCADPSIKSMEIYWTGLELTLMETSDYLVSDIRFAFK